MDKITTIKLELVDRLFELEKEIEKVKKSKMDEEEKEFFIDTYKIKISEVNRMFNFVHNL